jgi:hypothetical protein
MLSGMFNSFSFLAAVVVFLKPIEASTLGITELMRIFIVQFITFLTFIRSNVRYFSNLI